MGRVEILRKSNKRGGPNKRGGWKFSKKMINGETLINRKGGIYQNESNKRGGYLDIISILNKENGGKSK